MKETCPRCDSTGNCQVCEGYGYEFAGDGDGCMLCDHSGNCPTCGGRGELVIKNKAL